MEKTKICGEDSSSSSHGQITFVDYRDESQLEHVDRLVAVDLSEPYSIFTYRYFLNRYPDLCILAVDNKSGEVCGCVVGKIDVENMNVNSDPPAVILDDADVDTDNRNNSTHAAQQDINEDASDIKAVSAANFAIQTGYIGMLAVSKSYRRKGIGKDLVRQVLKRMKARGCTSVTLETEVSNVTAQKLYQDHFGFIREELLVRYYLNCGDAYRLRLWF
mmetsp:Transcript_19935/g.43343  ORF Transcript_19935/g.43343 Transcript_19935/m.43343 type:complete len:218 (+) Transcript_19935:96-749(+)